MTKPSARVLDENLQRLLTRAYVSQRPSASCRAAVHAAVAARARSLAEPVRVAARLAPGRWRTRVALAAVVLLGISAALMALLGDAAPARLDSPAPAGSERLVMGDAPRPLGPLPEGDPERLAPGRPHGATPVDDAPSLPAVVAGGGLALRVQLSFPEGWTPREGTRVTAVQSLRPPNTADPILADALEGQAHAFGLEVPEAGDYRVFVHAPGLGTQAVLVDFPRDPEFALEVPLEAAGELRGRVADAATGEPLAGAWVLSERDLPASTCNLRLEDDPHAASFAVRTDEQGRFVLRGLSAGAHRVRASSPGFAPAWAEARAKDPAEAWEELELRLGVSAAIEGSVRHPDGGVWPEVVVIASLTSSYTSDVHTYGAALTDAEGRYRIPDLGEGWYAVLNLQEWAEMDDPDARGGAMRGPGWQAPALRFAVLDEGGLERIDLPEFREGCRVSGRVLNRAGEHAAELSLMLMNVGLGEAWRAAGWHMSSTDTEGRFVFEGVPPGSYQLFHGEPGRVDMLLWGDLEVPDLASHELLVPLVGPRVRVRTLDDETGEPVPNAVVLIWQQRDGEDFYAGKFFSDSRGLVAFGPTAPGIYLLEAFAGDKQHGASPRAELLVGDDGELRELELRLPAGGGLAVLVLGAGGTPQAGVRVRLADELGRVRRFSETELSDADGRFVVEGLPLGRWQVAASRGGVELARTWVEIRRGDTALVELQLPGDGVTEKPEKD